jgi:TolB protein
VGADESGGTDLYLLELATLRVRRMTLDAAVKDQPSWSPAGDRIAYRRLDGERSSIWVASALLPHDFLGPWHHTRLSPEDAVEERPAWSPGGDRIAFVSRVAGSEDIWTMSASGTDRKRITSSTARETEPSWSPDGLIIAYARVSAGGASSIHLAASGEGPVWIHNPELGGGRLPAWSSDGARIAYVTRHGGRDEIGTMRPDGSDRRLFELHAPWSGGTNPAWIRSPQ